MEVLLAGYQSAGSGKRVEMPFRPRNVERPIDLWKNPRSDVVAWLENKLP